LPRDRMKGQDAFRRLKCYVGAPDDVAPKSVPSGEGKDVVKLNFKMPRKFSTIAEVVRLLK